MFRTNELSQAKRGLAESVYRYAESRSSFEQKGVLNRKNIVKERYFSLSKYSFVNYENVK